jgi:hypothetical protein
MFLRRLVSWHKDSNVLQTHTIDQPSSDGIAAR